MSKFDDKDIHHESDAEKVVWAEDNTSPAQSPTIADDETNEEGGEPAEVEILRAELSKMQAENIEVKAQADELNNKYLRARADLENYRRRAAQDMERAREAGLDSAVLTVLTVYDDLGRALTAADETDPGKIIPGVEAVQSGLKRNLEALGIREVGQKGEPFDHDLHEALSAIPTDDERLAGTIAEVFQVGFAKDERLVRPARVVVYQS